MVKTASVFFLENLTKSLDFVLLLSLGQIGLAERSEKWRPCDYELIVLRKAY